MGWDKELGSIEEGKVANFIVLDKISSKYQLGIYRD